jgi:hypothetical protein
MEAIPDRVRCACSWKKKRSIDLGFEPKRVAWEFSLVPTTPRRTPGSRSLFCVKHATCMQLLKVLEVTTSTWSLNVFIVAIWHAAYRSDINHKQGPPWWSWRQKMFVKTIQNPCSTYGAEDLITVESRSDLKAHGTWKHLCMNRRKLNCNTEKIDFFCPSILGQFWTPSPFYSRNYNQMCVYYGTDKEREEWSHY